MMLQAKCDLDSLVGNGAPSGSKSSAQANVSIILIIFAAELHQWCRQFEV